jgi:hypothetical protein
MGVDVQRCTLEFVDEDPAGETRAGPPELIRAMAGAFNDLLRSVRRREATAEDAAGTLYDELSEAETLSVLDGDADFEQGSWAMSAGSSARRSADGDILRRR